ncbi:MAG: protein tyrosine phosphatase family protein [Chloroflexota bacterium]
MLNAIINFVPLTDKLLTGGQPTESQFREAAEAGVQTVINLALDSSDNALPDKPGLVRSLGMAHVHIPVVWGAPQAEDLQRFMDEMDARRGEKVLVHCALNYRVSCFVALWRVLRQGWEREEAFEPLRKIWDPADHPVWEQFIADSLGRP